jgi:glycosyltransferase involved in cell wall biosynthesis
MSYGQWYAAHPETIVEGCEVTLLVPKAFVGAFGDKVDYLEARDIYRLLPCLMPRYDLWHSIHQMSPFRPSSRSTRRIVTIHDVNFIYEKRGAKRQKYTHRLQRECDSADVICFISRFAQNDTAKHINIGGKPQHVIYNGVATLTEGPQEPVAQVSDGTPFMLSIGVLKAKKNLHTLLPMMDLMPGFRLIIAGDDSDSYAQQLRDQLPQHPNVSIVGTVSNEQRRWLYAHCSALLFPSLSEGFGLPIIEAMQWGKPVFCSDRTSLPEIGSTHAFYFTDFGPESMAAVVKRGLAAFDATAALAEQKYAAAYSYESHMRQYWSIYTNK